MSKAPILYDLSKWEDITLRYNTKFMERFCKVTDAFMVIGVWWSSETMKIEYVCDGGQTISDGFKIEEWLEFVEEVTSEE